MKKVHIVFALAGVLAIWNSPRVNAGVQVDAGDTSEKLVTFQMPDHKYITANPGGELDGSGLKVGSKQRFSIVDLNGGDLKDGDSIKIRYNPGVALDATKSTYWIETAQGIKRGHDADTFKVKKVDTKYALQAPSGKYVAAPGPAGSGAL